MAARRAQRGTPSAAPPARPNAPSPRPARAAVRALRQDSRVVVIPDRRPAAAAHLLVIPRDHVANVTSLAPADAGLGEAAAAAGLRAVRGPARALAPTLLADAAAARCAVRHMQEVGRQVLAEQLQLQQLAQPTQPQRQPPFKFGFHKPPFRSVDHLQ